MLDGAVVLTATNTVNTDRDPTAHAETNLIAAAIRRLDPAQLSRATLYTSCEPCAMCAGKMYWAGIRSVVYALSSEELAAFAGRDFLVPCRELFARAASTTRSMENHRIFRMPFASVYPHYVQKAEKRGRTKGEVDKIICWLTGYSQQALAAQIAQRNDFATFFREAPAFHPNAGKITGVVCGVRIEEITIR